jgi:mitochondrial fission process protein 1
MVELNASRLNKRIVVTLQKSWSSESERRKCVSYAVVDTVLWQGLASVAIPGFTINRLCWISNGFLRRAFTSLPAPARKWTVTAIGLSAIPLIIHPIDHLVDYMMDNTLRKFSPIAEKATSVDK